MKIIEKLLNKKGFTLVELIIIIAMAAVVLTPITMMLTSVLSNSALIEKQMEATMSTQDIFVYINEDIRANSFADVSIINYFGHHALKVDDRVYFNKTTGFVIQNFSIVSEQLSTEKVLSKYVHNISFTFESVELLSIELKIDKNLDGNENDTYLYKIAARN